MRLLKLAHVQSNIYICPTATSAGVSSTSGCILLQLLMALQMVHEQDAVEVVDLVLKSLGKKAIGA